VVVAQQELKPTAMNYLFDFNNVLKIKKPLAFRADG